MTNREKIQELIAWLDDHKEKFPPVFYLAKGVKIIDSKKCLASALSCLIACSEDRFGPAVVRTVYFRAHDLKTWYENQQL